MYIYTGCCFIVYIWGPPKKQHHTKCWKPWVKLPFMGHVSGSSFLSVTSSFWRGVKTTQSMTVRELYVREHLKGNDTDDTWREEFLAYLIILPPLPLPPSKYTAPGCEGMSIWRCHTLYSFIYVLRNEFVWFRHGVPCVYYPEKIKYVLHNMTTWPVRSSHCVGKPFLWPCVYKSHGCGLQQYNLHVLCWCILDELWCKCMINACCPWNMLFELDHSCGATLCTLSRSTPKVHPVPTFMWCGPGWLIHCFLHSWESGPSLMTRGAAISMVLFQPWLNVVLWCVARGVQHRIQITEV